jgi:splicing factor 3A subunit 2
MGLLFTVSLPEIKTGERPRRRFMSAFEQKREVPNRAFQYFIVCISWLNCANVKRLILVQLAAEPYETIAFAIPSKEMVEEEEDTESTWEHWDPDEKVYSCQFLFK